MNWGKGIAIALGLFIVFIVYMVVGFFSHRVDLESDDYYQREIDYQTEITSLNNANQLKEKPEIKLSETHVVIQFSSEEDFENIQLDLKRPNDVHEDKVYAIRDTKTFTINKESLKPGVYTAILSYSIGDKNCLQKQQIYI